MERLLFLEKRFKAGSIESRLFRLFKIATRKRFKNCPSYGSLKVKLQSTNHKLVIEKKSQPENQLPFAFLVRFMSLARVDYSETGSFPEKSRKEKQETVLFKLEKVYSLF